MILALAGGVGGAKLADGLTQLLSDALAILVNTGDDFEHLGLTICPDLDTVMYTLGGIAEPSTGWGVAGESWAFLDQVVRLGGPAWFRLGDRDIATHVLRSERLRRGESLTSITADLAQRLGVKPRLLPMSDSPVRTLVQSPQGSLPFQEYFVRLHCAVTVTGFTFAGSDRAAPPPELAEALADPRLSAIILCPSNPFVSIGPILAIPGLRQMLRARGVPIVAVSPIIGGAAVKGPAAKMMRELGMEPSAFAIAELYRGFIDGLLLDETDIAQVPRIASLGIAARAVPSLMTSAADRRRLAEAAVAFAAELSARS